MIAVSDPVVLPVAEWRAREQAHEARVDALTAGHRDRRPEHRRHPVEDFLFQYYNHTPAQLRRWHPGPGVVLAGAADLPRAQWRHYRTRDDGGVELDSAGFVAARGSTVTFVRDLLTAIRSRPAFTGCFGLHEWAMVYRTTPTEIRHSGWPLRLGHAGTDAVVESHQLRCTHFDAFRFFTPGAAPRNAEQPTRERQVDLEQPGCVHAGMDTYKWAFKLAPSVPSELTLDTFAHAMALRTLDMQASPYDLAALGYAPLPIETPEGKTEYVRRQRELADTSNALRERLIEVCRQMVE
ncbi:3-methyladenine DNA glycosylase [Kribbia dieselivorans]|uniref:3-methyladenine DNA glycosylase n=1 Tax=Kribbia dieselivorans TaxID=331526 RepID=UPI000B15CD8E